MVGAFERFMHRVTLRKSCCRIACYWIACAVGDGNFAAPRVLFSKLCVSDPVV